MKRLILTLILFAIVTFACAKTPPPTQPVAAPVPAPSSTPAPDTAYRMFCKAPGFRRGDVRNGFAYIIQRLVV
jgi:hypothetical protein